MRIRQKHHLGRQTIRQIPGCGKHREEVVIVALICALRIRDITVCRFQSVSFHQRGQIRQFCGICISQEDHHISSAGKICLHRRFFFLRQVFGRRIHQKKITVLRFPDSSANLALKAYNYFYPSDRSPSLKALPPRVPPSGKSSCSRRRSHN